MSAGTYEKYVLLENLIPTGIEDATINQIFDFPHYNFADYNLIFKLNQEKEFFIFDKETNWNEDNLTLSELEFENLFDENLWIYKNYVL